MVFSSSWLWLVSASSLWVGAGRQASEKHSPVFMRTFKWILVFTAAEIVLTFPTFNTEPGTFEARVHNRYLGMANQRLPRHHYHRDVLSSQERQLLICMSNSGRIEKLCLIRRDLIQNERGWLLKPCLGLFGRKIHNFGPIDPKLRTPNFGSSGILSMILWRHLLYKPFQGI